MNSSFVIALSVMGDLIFEVVELMWMQLLSLALRFSEVSYRSLSDCCYRYTLQKVILSFVLSIRG